MAYKKSAKLASVSGVDGAPPSTDTVAWATRGYGRYVALVRHRRANDPETVAAPGEIDVARFEDHIRAVVDTAPRLTAEQMERLRALPPPAGGVQ